MRSLVTWSKHDADVPKGDVGQAVSLKKGRISVQFPKAKWTFKTNQLIACKIQPGNYVAYKHSDEDIPRGHIGEVVREKAGVYVANHGTLKSASTVVQVSS